MSPHGVGAIGGKQMPASRKRTFEQFGKAKPLPPHFGPIDPQAPFDPERFYTAMACLGYEPSVGYLIDTGELSLIVRKLPRLKTTLQKKRNSDLCAWEAAQDPKREKQFTYLKNLVASLNFAPGGRYFEFAI
jgi:hypothetical protein